MTLETLSAAPLATLDRKACPDCACRTRCLLGRQDEAVRAAWEPHVRERRFRKGEVLQRQGHVPATTQVLKVGTVLLQRRAADGVDRPVGMAGCGQAMGTSALLQRPADLSCVAVAPGRVCEIDVARLQRNGLLGNDFFRELAIDQWKGQALLADWARILHIRGSAGQLAGALLLIADLQRSSLVRLPSHSVLAALLFTTRETVARGVALLTREGGLVRHDRWHGEIVRNRLTELARGQQPGHGAGQAAAGPTAAAAATASTAPARQAGLAGSFSSACTSAASACAPLP